MGLCPPWEIRLSPQRDEVWVAFIPGELLGHFGPLPVLGTLLSVWRQQELFLINHHSDFCSYHKSEIQHSRPEQRSWREVLQLVLRLPEYSLGIQVCQQVTRKSDEDRGWGKSPQTPLSFPCPRVVADGLVLLFFFYRENILVLDIFFEALNYETIEQKKAYEVAALLGKEV